MPRRNAFLNKEQARYFAALEKSGFSRAFFCAAFCKARENCRGDFEVAAAFYIDDKKKG